MLKRGRPVEKPIEEQPRKFIREVKFNDGVIQKSHFNLDKHPNGPFLVEMFYPEGYFLEEKEENLPKTKRKYLNPKTGKMVNYFRAKELKLI